MKLLLACLLLFVLLTTNVLADDTFKLKQTLGKDGVVVYWFHNLTVTEGWTTILLSPTNQEWVMHGLGYTAKTKGLSLMPVFYLKIDTTKKHLPVKDLVFDLLFWWKFRGCRFHTRTKAEINPRNADMDLFFTRCYLEYYLGSLSFGLQEESISKEDTTNLWLGPNFSLKLAPQISLTAFTGVKLSHPHSKRVWWELKLKL